MTAQRAYCFEVRVESKIVSRENTRSRLQAPPHRHGPGRSCQDRASKADSTAAIATARRATTRRSRLQCRAPSRPHHSTTVRQGSGPAALHRLRGDNGRPRRRPAIKRLVNAQQNAHRCDPSGGDPGGCAARPTRRGIRLQVSEPQAASWQHLSGQGDARRAVAASGFRRLRRQPSRVSRLQRNTSRLLPNPGGRPAGAHCRGRARPACRRRRGRSSCRAPARAPGARQPTPTRRDQERADRGSAVRDRRDGGGFRSDGPARRGRRIRHCKRKPLRSRLRPTSTHPDIARMRRPWRSRAR